MYPCGPTKNEEGVLPVTTPPETVSLIMQLHLLLLAVLKTKGICVRRYGPERDEWGATAPRKKEALKCPAKRVVIHHTALPNCTGLKECASRLVSIQKGHMTDRGFDDIGYNFLVAGDGTVYEGRGWGVIGAHAKGSNHDSLGVAFMGNFNNDTPSTEAISSVKCLLQKGVSEGHLCPEFVLQGHKDLGQTECPGEKLYAALPQLRGTK